MKRWHYVVLFLAGLLVPYLVSRFQSVPGYMDADYYFTSGLQLAQGRGFTEPYLWNYLDDPQGLPHPSHTYWMPLASIVSALGMWLSGQTAYAAGRLPFILLSAFVPVLTAALAFDLSRQPRLALTSGLLAVFSMYYAPFLPVPDNYALFMLLGGTFLLLAPRPQKWIPLALGALAGAMTLARSDGLLWLGLAGLAVWWNFPVSFKESNWAEEFARKVIPSGLLLLLGYLLIMGGWHYRNYTLFGTLMPPGSSRLLWLETYNQTFAYPASSVTREGFLRAGFSAALQDRLTALKWNAGTMLAPQGGIFLFPFILTGLWTLRGQLRTRLAVTGWLILFAVMTLVFPFAGMRGSFLHAGAAFQPYWWAAAPLGLDVVITAARRRGMFDENARLVFPSMLVILAAIVTAYLIASRVMGGWGAESRVYAEVEQRLLEDGASLEVGVIVRNPPAYYLYSGRPVMALPYGDEETILQVAEKFGAGYLILEKGGTFEAIQDLYDHPQSHPSFFFLGEVNDAKIYRILLP
ncbi:MAG: hypothetical protein ACOYYF_04945 [Chloroflexota bacterium]|nr:hypothetical protein [Chloroflexota bacterium]MBI5702795.1 hypothetical protein [Chloroflexota bacterium]